MSRDAKGKSFFWRTYWKFIDWFEQISQNQTGSSESSDANLGHSSKLAHAVCRGVVTYLQLCIRVYVYAYMCIHICTYIYLPSVSQNGQTMLSSLDPAVQYIYTHYTHSPMHKPSYEFSGRTKASKHYRRTN